MGDGDGEWRKVNPKSAVPRWAGPAYRVPSWAGLGWLAAVSRQSESLGCVTAATPTIAGSAGS